jgi:hypothetical protein
VELEVGARYVVEIPGEGEVTASLCGAEAPLRREGDGQLPIPRWRVEYQGLEYIIFEQAILRPVGD